MLGGYGKIILLGEHFVVHDSKALVVALPLKTYASVKYSHNAEWRLIDDRPKVPTYRATKHDTYLNMLKNIALAMHIKEPLEVILHGTLPVTSGGIGSSAAAAVAITRALSEFIGAQWSPDDLNNFALQGECCVHGNPSGIDNTAALYGGIFIYERSTIHKQPVHYTLIKQLHLVIADSGVTNNTAVVIQALHERMKAKAGAMKSFFDEYAQLVQPAHWALKQGDWEALGLLMCRNHQILRIMGLSTPELDTMVTCVLRAGALGAKLTGTGKGGIMVALTSGVDSQELVAQALSNLGYWTLRVTV